MNGAEERLRRVLGVPELNWLVERVRSRLERGLPLDGVVTLGGASAAQRQAAARLLGRPIGRGTSLSVPLPSLAEALRAAGIAADLRLAVETVSGPVPDRAGDRATEDDLRRSAIAAASDCRYAGAAWHTAWLDQLTSDGTLTRLLRTGRTDALAKAAAVLDLLPAADLPLPVLAEHATGDTKALSTPPLAGLVLRALALWHDLPVPASQQARRTLWEAAGVIVDDLASQVLVLGLPATGSRLGHWLTEAAALGEPFRVTLHQLTAMPVRLLASEVYVCENPAVLRAAAAELGAASAALICTEGLPSAACHRLVAIAARVRWRGDFDWVGLRTTATAIQRYTAKPWRMDVRDYLAALGTGPSEALRGAPAASPWSPELAVEMQRSARAVMEERLLAALLADLGCAGPPARPGSFTAPALRRSARSVPGH